MGASFTAATVTALVAAMLLLVPSLTVTLRVRLAVFGLSEVLVYVTVRKAVCHCASVALALAEVSVSTPVALL